MPERSLPAWRDWIAPRQCPGRRKDGQRGVERQHVVRELGRDNLEHHPGCAAPGEKKAHCRAGTAGDRVAKSRRKKQDRRPETDRQQCEIIAGPSAMGLLTGSKLGSKVLAERLLVELAVTGHQD